jgi:putative endopeptidase
VTRIRKYGIALFAAVLGAATLVAAPQATSRQAAAPPTVHGIDVAGMDRSVKPGDNFFAYANAAWFRSVQIPPDRAAIGIWDTLNDRATTNVRELLEGTSDGDNADTRKARDYYASYLDEASIEKSGLRPLSGFIKQIGAITDRRALTDWICSNIRADVDPLNATNFHTDHLFGVWISQDFNQPTRYTPYLLQGGLGMPDRDYYLDGSKEMESIRGSYRAHIAAMLRLGRVADADAKAGRIYALEKQIAAVHATRTDSADVSKGNNPWQRDAFPARAPGVDWQACFAAAGLQSTDHFIVWHPGAVKGIAALVGSEPLDTWRDYFTFHLLDRYAGVLPKAFVDERFAFYGKVLSGTSQLRPRWKRAVDATNGALGDAVGRMYVKRYFAPEAKARLQAIVATIVHAFELRIDRLEWMNPKTKASAKAKLASLRVGIGYPDRWRDYSALNIVRGDAFMNAWRAELADYEYHRAKLGGQVDRDEWWMTPQTVNAVNLPVQNALNFPAAILQPPFYDPAASAANIYGAIGTVIGHEISHSFDDQGSQFDATGKLSNWWTPEDFAQFKAASAKLVAQYNAYEPFPGLHLNGQLTLSENIADLGGLAAAYDAYRAAKPAGTSPAGFTGEQDFFLSWAQNWRTKMRDAMLRQIVVTDGHAPDEYRADTVRNLDAWYQAFGVAPGQKLFLAPADRVRVW